MGYDSLFDEEFLRGYYGAGPYRTPSKQHIEFGRASMTNSTRPSR
jgi:hypothetical protein